MKKAILLLALPLIALFADVSNEQILKKLENIDKKVQNIDKKVQTIEHNQELLKQEMKLRFEAVDKRFESVDKRFESVDKRFEILTNFMLALTAGIFGLIGFMMWDRRTVAQKVKEECKQEIDIQSKIIETKADKEYLDRFVKAMNEILVLKDETAINVFRKYGLL